jgi:hypothetical protein
MNSSGCFSATQHILVTQVENMKLKDILDQAEQKINARSELEKFMCASIIVVGCLYGLYKITTLIYEHTLPPEPPRDDKGGKAYATVSKTRPE